MTETTHNPFNEAHRVSCLRENLTSSSDGEGLETGCAMSSVPRHSLTRQTAFQELEGHLHSAINTLGYPQAALFGFCVALVAYNAMAVVFAALRSVHGAEKIDQEVSGYYIANEIAETYRGLNIAIPEPHCRGV